MFYVNMFKDLSLFHLFLITPSSTTQFLYCAVINSLLSSGFTSYYSSLSSLTVVVLCAHHSSWELSIREKKKWPVGLNCYFSLCITGSDSYRSQATAAFLSCGILVYLSSEMNRAVVEVKRYAIKCGKNILQIAPHTEILQYVTRP